MSTDKPVADDALPTPAAGWIEGPHGAIRANPLAKFSVPTTVSWSIPLFTADQMRAAIARERERHQQAAAWCDKHKPSGGTRAVCLVCSGLKLQAALSRISYLCGEPNEMECGPYDLHCDEDAVVEQVRALRQQLANERDHQFRALHEPDVCDGVMSGAPPRYTPMCVVLRQHLAEATQTERERIARMLDAEHEKEKHRHNYAAFYARMIRESAIAAGAQK